MRCHCLPIASTVSRYRLHDFKHITSSFNNESKKYGFKLLLPSTNLNVGRVGSLLRVLNIMGDLVETNLLGDPLSSCSVLGTGLIIEDSVDLF
jgi:hypothetical protein